MTKEECFSFFWTHINDCPPWCSGIDKNFVSLSGGSKEIFCPVDRDDKDENYFPKKNATRRCVDYYFASSPSPEFIIRLFACHRVAEGTLVCALGVQSIPLRTASQCLALQHFNLFHYMAVHC